MPKPDEGFDRLSPNGFRIPITPSLSKGRLSPNGLGWRACSPFALSLSKGRAELVEAPALPELGEMPVPMSAPRFLRQAQDDREYTLSPNGNFSC
ncbi:MAG TPA: hypothetical protein VGE16_00130 [Albitalea sp.]